MLQKCKMFKKSKSRRYSLTATPKLDDTDYKKRLGKTHSKSALIPTPPIPQTPELEEPYYCRNGFLTMADLPMVEAELTDVELTELKDIFAMFDKDNSGSIDIKELDAMVSSLGIAATPEDLHDMIQEADLDGSGTIEFSEFKLLIGPHFQKEKPPEDYVEAFKFFDKDGDGFISRTELRHIMNTVDVSLAEADIEEMIKEADANGDGKIDFDEFIKMMQSQ